MVLITLGFSGPLYVLFFSPLLSEHFSVLLDLPHVFLLLLGFISLLLVSKAEFFELYHVVVFLYVVQPYFHHVFQNSGFRVLFKLLILFVKLEVQLIFSSNH